MRNILRIGLCLGFLGTLFTAIAVAVEWQIGNGGFKIGLWQSCTSDNGCRFRRAYTQCFNAHDVQCVYGGLWAPVMQACG